MINLLFDNTKAILEGDVPKDLDEVLYNTMAYWEPSGKKSFKRKHVYSKVNKSFPTGLISYFIQIIGDNYKYKIIDNRKKPHNDISLTWKHPYDLRYYQKEAVEAATKATRGRLKIPTGGGKSLLYAYLTYKLSKRTVIVVNSIDALMDTYSEFVLAFGEENIGRVGNGFKQYKDITIITGKSLAKRVDKFQNYDVLIVDEVHRSGSPTWLKSIYDLDCYYKIGGSGTQFRNDGKDLLLQAAFGKVLYEVHTKDLQKEEFLNESDIIYIELTKPVSRVNYSDYKEVYDDLIVGNEYRNKMVVEVLKSHPKNQVLILVKLIEHGEILLNMIKEALDENVVFIHGSTKKDERAQHTEAFRNKDIRVVISSTIFNESVNIPTVEVAIDAAAGTSGVAVIQKLGRILRRAEGKGKSIYYNFYDKFHPMLKKQSEKRIKELKKENHKISYIMLDD